MRYLDEKQTRALKALFSREYRCFLTIGQTLNDTSLLGECRGRVKKGGGGVSIRFGANMDEHVLIHEFAHSVKPDDGGSIAEEKIADAIAASILHGKNRQTVVRQWWACLGHGKVWTDKYDHYSASSITWSEAFRRADERIARHKKLFALLEEILLEAME